VRARKGKVAPPTFYDWSLRIHEPKTGKLDFDRFPFQREWYAEGHDDPDTVTVKATQIGASAHIVRWTMYWADVHGWTVIYVFPKQNLMYDFSDTRVKELIEQSGYLRGRIAQSSVQNKGLRKIGNGFVYYRGSESTDGLESIDGDALALDEYDLLVAENIPIVERRLSGSLHGLVRRLGVPSVPGFGLDALYRKTDQRRWWVRCECGESQPVFFNAQHDEDDLDGVVTGYVDQEQMRVVCGHCALPLDVADGEWVATYPDRGVRGYHASRLIVPAVAENRRGLLETVVAASKQTEPFNRQVHNNRDLGEAYAPSEGRLSLAAIQAAQREFTQVTGYVGNNLITAGIDVASVRALNVRISEHLPNDTKRALFIGQVESFNDLPGIMRAYGVHLAAIDHLPEGRLARSFAERFPGRVYLVALTGPALTMPLAVNEPERLASVRRTEAIDATFAMIREQRNQLPLDLPEGYTGHLQAPVRFMQKDDVGKVVVGYRSSGPDDYAMCEVYDLVAGELWNYRQTLDQYAGVLQPLEERFEFERSHLGDPDAYEEGGHFGLGPGAGDDDMGGDYSPGFDG
jgi:hypothetical protein